MSNRESKLDVEAVKENIDTDSYMKDSRCINIISSTQFQSTGNIIVIDAIGQDESISNSEVRLSSKFDAEKNGFQHMPYANDCVSKEEPISNATTEPSKLSKDEDKSQPMVVVSGSFCEEESVSNTTTEPLKFSKDENESQPMVVVNSSVCEEEPISNATTEPLKFSKDENESQPMVVVNSSVCEEEPISNATTEPSKLSKGENESQPMVVVSGSVCEVESISNATTESPIFSSAANAISDDHRVNSCCNSNSGSAIEVTKVDVETHENIKGNTLPSNVVTIISKPEKPTFNDVFVNVVRSQMSASAIDDCKLLVSDRIVSKRISKPCSLASLPSHVTSIPAAKPELRPVAKLLCDISVELIGENVCKEVLLSQSSLYKKMALEDKIKFDYVKASYHRFRKINEPFKCDMHCCSQCLFGCSTRNEYERHLDYGHMKWRNGNLKYECSLCSLELSSETQFSRHMLDIHKRKARIDSIEVLEQCPVCLIESRSTAFLLKHKIKCLKHYDPKVHLAPVYSTLDIPVWSSQVPRLCNVQNMLSRPIQTFVQRQPVRNLLPKVIRPAPSRSSQAPLQLPPYSRSNSIYVPRLLLRLPLPQQFAGENLMSSSSSSAQAQHVAATKVSSKASTASVSQSGSKMIRLQLVHSAAQIRASSHTATTGHTREQQLDHTYTTVSPSTEQRGIGHTSSQTINEVICHICDSKFDGFRNLNQHITNVHQLVMPDCSEIRTSRPQMSCNESPSKSVLNLSHTVVSKVLILCEVCGLSMLNSVVLFHHLVNVHKLEVNLAAVLGPESDRFAGCSYCLRRFFTNLGLIRHIRNSHPGSKVPYICCICRERSNINIVEHLFKMHEISVLDMFNQMTCFICKCKMDSVAILREHMLYHHQDLFPNSSFLVAAIESLKLVGDASNAVTHAASSSMSLSSAVSPSPDSVLLVANPEINRSQNITMSKSTLSNRLQIVAKSNVKFRKINGQFACTLPCKRNFSTAEELRYHQKTKHPFRCSRCKNVFTCRDFLQQHYKTVHHLETDPCPLCNHRVQIGRPMMRHMKVEHLRDCSVVVRRLSPSVIIDKLCRRRKCVIAVERLTNWK